MRRLELKTGVPSKWRAEVEKAHFFDFLNPPPLSSRPGLWLIERKRMYYIYFDFDFY